MIELTRVRELDLRVPSAPGRRAHVSAASGLVVADDHLYVIADDEHYLGAFPAHGDAPGELVELFPGALPSQRKERKAAKPDLETLARLPAFPGFPDGALFALGSGSRANRSRGAIVPLIAGGALAGVVRVVDAAPLYAALGEQLAKLNIEGVVVVDTAMWLLHRGNRRGSANALVELSLAGVLDALIAQRPIGADVLRGVVPVDLGGIDGITLGFTDGTALPDGTMLFCAAAENTDDAYHDGPSAGGVVGVIDRDRRAIAIERLEGGTKVEGIAARVDGDVVHMLLVTDADDEDVPAQLLSGEMRLR